MTTRSHFVKKARKDYPDAGVKKGESYYWWKFNFSQFIHRSKTAPTRSQLTKSPFLAQIYSLEDRVNKIEYDNVDGELDDIKSEIESLRDEQEEKRSNMPEQLQESDVGNLLQERYDCLDEWYNELDGFNLDEVDEEDIKSDVEAELNKEEDETDEDFDARIEEEVKQRVQEAKDEAVDELHGICYSGS